MWWHERADRSAAADCSALSDEEVVDAYFTDNEGEFYTIEPAKVDFPD